MFKQKCPSCGAKNSKERTVCIECGVPFELARAGGQAVRVSRPKTVGETGGITSDRSRLVKVAVGLVILKIFYGFASQLPGGSTHLMEGFFVGNIIKLVIAVIMLAVVILARHRLAAVITHYARRTFKVEQHPTRAKVEASMDGLSTELSNIVIIFIAWPIVAQIISQLLLIDAGRDLGWVWVIVNLGFVGILLYRLYKGYQLLEPVKAVITGKAKEWFI